jgi:hypothetical protein
VELAVEVDQNCIKRGIMVIMDHGTRSLGGIGEANQRGGGVETSEFGPVVHIPT